MTSLDSLRLAAAVTSGWPVLTVFVPDEATMLDARSRIEAAIGALPQTDEIEPWEPWEPDWELRIALPGASAETILSAQHAVAPHRSSVRAGPPPGLMHDQDMGRPTAERTASGGLVGELLFDPEEGGTGKLNLRRCDTDDAIADLGIEMALALQQGDVAHGFHSHQGTDTVGPVVHRPTGRVGVYWQFRPGDDPERQAVLAALQPLVLSRANHPHVRVAPDFRFDVDSGLGVTAWLVTPAVPGLPADAIEPVKRGEVAAIIDGLDTSHELEVHVLPATPAQFDEAVQAVQAFALPDDALMGDSPRWVGGAPAFALVWRLEVNALPARAIDDWAVRIQDHPAIHAVRVVPGAPRGLQARWRGLQPAWRVVQGTVFQRIYDPLLDRDRLPERTPADTPAWASALSELPGVLSVRGFTGSDGSDMAMLRLVPDAIHESVIAAILDGVARQRPVQARPVVWWGYEGDHGVLVLTSAPTGPMEPSC